jgi:anti-anti-sigma factor
LEEQTMTTTFLPGTVLPHLHIDVSRPSPLTVQVTPAGEVDLATAHVLRDVMLRVLREQAPTLLDVDLAGVTFFDCSGIGTLVAVRDVAVQAGCHVMVSNPRPIVRRVLDLTGLLDAFTAPIGRPQPARSAHPAGIGPAPTTVTPVPHIMAAA